MEKTKPTLKRGSVLLEKLVNFYCVVTKIDTEDITVLYGDGSAREITMSEYESEFEITETVLPLNFLLDICRMDLGDE